MPTATRLLDYGDFVRRPEAALSRDFTAYLERADRLVRHWRAAEDAWQQAPAADLERRKRQMGAALAERLSAFRDRYTRSQVQRDPAFVDAATFFARCREVRRPLAILHCDLDMPLHTVQRFDTPEQLAALNAALRSEVPLRWWRNGPTGRPCYLFGAVVWELKAAEVGVSDEQLAPLFQRASVDVSEESGHAKRVCLDVAT